MKKEENSQDDYDREVSSRANACAVLVIIILALIFFSVQFFTGGGVNYGLSALVFGAIAAENWVKYSRLKRRRELIFALAFTFAAAVCAGHHIGSYL